jgi:hypothetical protein
LNVVTSEEGNFTTTKDDPQFVDAANMNFKLKDDAKVFTEIKGFEPIPFEKIGLLDDRKAKPRSKEPVPSQYDRANDR